MWCGSIQNNHKSEGFVSNLFQSMTKKDEVSKFFCTKSAHARSFKSLLHCNAEWACLHHVLIEVTNSSRNIQMGGPLLELRGRHMVVLQVKVLQVTLVRQLVDIVAEYFTFWLFAQVEVSPLLADPAILVVPFSSVAVRSQEVSKISKEPDVQGLRHQWLDHVLLRAVPFL